MSFDSSMAAKQFLVSRIVREASHRHVRLTDVEQGMLLFSETYPTLPNMVEIAEKFENEYDDEEYEKKISELAKNAYRRDSKEASDMAQLWREAVEVLEKEDHYILVMLDVSRDASDILRLLLTALIVVCAGLSVIVALNWFGQAILPQIPDSVLWIALVLVMAVLIVLSSSDKAGKATSKFVVRLEELITGSKPASS